MDVRPGLNGSCPLHNSFGTPNTWKEPAMTDSRPGFCGSARILCITCSSVLSASAQAKSYRPRLSGNCRAFWGSCPAFPRGCPRTLDSYPSVPDTCPDLPRRCPEPSGSCLGPSDRCPTLPDRRPDLSGSLPERRGGVLTFPSRRPGMLANWPAISTGFPQFKNSNLRAYRKLPVSKGEEIWPSTRRLFQLRAAGLAFAVSKSFSAMPLGTGSKHKGSIEWAARPFDSDRIAVA